jgi:hypothetical protein
MLQRRISDVGKSQFLTPEPARNALLKFQAAYPFPKIEGPGFSENNSQENWSAYRYLSSVDLDILAVNAGLRIDEYINLLTTASMSRALALFRKAARVVNDKRKNSPRIKSIEAIEAEEFVPPAKPR